MLSWTCYVLSLHLVPSTEVVLEETTSQGAADTAPMRLYDLIVMLEKKGILDTSVTGHAVDRPAEVKRGEEQDRVEVVHESYSLFKPNNVAAKTAKATNVAGVVGFKALSSSNYLQLVWRCWALYLRTLTLLVLFKHAIKFLCIRFANI